MVIHGILLAAGEGRRMGGPKALVEFAGETLHARAVERFRAAGLNVISVVNAQVGAALPPARPGEIRLVNGDPGHADGMFPASSRTSTT